MGVMRFEIHPEAILADWPEAFGGYLSGLDGRVFHTRVELSGNVLTCRRDVSDSGRFHVAWPVAGLGRPVLSTGTLCERDAAYSLPVELARGKLCQISSPGCGRLAALNGSAAEFAAARNSARQDFIQAITSPDRRAAAAHAQRSLEHACRAAALAAQKRTDRQGSGGETSSTRPISLSSRLPAAPKDTRTADYYLGAFNAVTVPVEWRLVEPEEGQWDWGAVDELVAWSRQHRLLIRGGPLFDLSPCGMPAWVWRGPSSPAQLQNRICRFVESAVQRYVSQIRVWEVAARANSGGDPTLDEEQRLGLVAYALDLARQVDEDAQLVIRVDQPWGAYQARGQHRLTPLQFVDALLRCGVGLSAVVLEVGLGYRPRGTAARDLLELYQLLDTWSSLGVPLQLMLAFPSSAETDSLVEAELEVDTATWKQPWSEEAQANWIGEVMPVLMAIKSVSGVIWSHFSDGDPHEFPHAGLVRPDGTPKPGYASFIASCAHV